MFQQCPELSQVKQQRYLSDQPQCPLAMVSFAVSSSSGGCPAWLQLSNPFPHCCFQKQVSAPFPRNSPWLKWELPTLPPQALLPYSASSGTSFIQLTCPIPHSPFSIPQSAAHTIPWFSRGPGSAAVFLLWWSLHFSVQELTETAGSSVVLLSDFLLSSTKNRGPCHMTMKD